MKPIWKNFFKVWGITTIASAIPLGYLGMVFGLVSQTIAAVAITFFFYEELSK